VKVGQLARLAGVSVRTLHHYEEEGLLVGARSASGHRLYSERDLARLREIQLLQSLGLSLAEVRECLAAPAGFLRSRLRLLQLRAERELALATERLRRLEELSRLPDEGLVERLKEVVMFEKYYTPEQLEALRERAGEAEQGQRDWATLLASVRSCMERGVPASAPEVKALAARADELVRAFTGGDPELAASLKRMYENEDPTVVSRGAVDREVMEYLAQARQ